MARRSTRTSPALPSTRQTRSQSRETSVDPQLRATRARSRQTSTSVEDQAAIELNATRNTRQNAVPSAAKELETLPEDIEETGEDIEPGDSASGDDERIPTHSQAELEDIDSERMMDHLGDLYERASQLLRRLCSEPGNAGELRSLVQQLQDTDSDIRKQVDRWWNDMNTVQKDFGSTHFLRPDIILRSILGIESVMALPDKSWRPDDIIQNANLATLVYRTVTSPINTTWLESCDQEFPKPFAHGFNVIEEGPRVGNSALIAETLQLALELRTQFAIAAVIEKGDVTLEQADQMLANLMWSATDGQIPKGWEDLRLPENFEVGGSTFARSIAQRLEEIRQLVFQSEEGPVDLQSGMRWVQERFPWEGFQVQVLQWAKSRNSEIKQNLDRFGGTYAIVISLTKERQRRSSNTEALSGEKRFVADVVTSSAVPRPRISSASTPVSTDTNWKRKGTPKDVFKAAKKQRTAQQKQKVPGDQPVSNAVTKGTSSTSNAPAERAPSVRATQTVQERDIDMGERIANAQRQRQERNNVGPPKKRFVDPQPSGVKVPFEGSTPSQSNPTAQRGFRVPPGSVTETIQPSVEMHDHGDDDIVPSEDEGFQQDARSMPPPDRPAQSASAAQTSNLTPQPNSTEPRPPMDTSEAEQARPRKNPGQSIDPLPASTGNHYADMANQANLDAKLKRRKLAQHKQQKNRKAWTTEETGALIEYIAEHCEDCVSYAFIKQMDDAGRLAERDAEQLRFKARNIKVNFLIGGHALPENFDKVFLDKKAIDQLKKHGVQYEQERVRGAAELSD